MGCGLHAVSVPVFARMLRNVSALLDTAVADAGVRHFEPAVLLSSRLYPDMFPLLRQVQLACDFAKGASARLAGLPAPVLARAEAELRDRSTEMQGIDYLNRMAMPNFYFHVTTAYAILRHNGVPIGKRDFVGV